MSGFARRALSTDRRKLQADQAVERGGVGQQIGGAGAVDDAAALDDDGVGGERQCNRGMLLDQHDRRAFVRHHAAQGVHQLVDDDGCEAFQRLVQQQQLRIGHQRTGDGQHLLLTAGQLVAHVAAALGQPRKQIVHGLQCPAAGPGGDRQVLLQRQRGEYLALLRDPAEAQPCAPVRGGAGDVAALPDDAAAGEPGLPHDGEQQRAFADAIAAEHGQAAARRHGERDILQDRRVAIAGAHALQFQQGLSHGAPCRGRLPSRAGWRRSRPACLRPAPGPPPAR